MQRARLRALVALTVTSFGLAGASTRRRRRRGRAIPVAEAARRPEPGHRAPAGRQRLPRRHRPADREQRHRQRRAGRRGRVPSPPTSRTCAARPRRIAYVYTVGRATSIGASPAGRAAFHDEPIVEEIELPRPRRRQRRQPPVRRGCRRAEATSTAAATRSTAAWTVTASPAPTTTSSRPTSSTRSRQADLPGVLRSADRDDQGRLRRDDAGGHPASSTRPDQGRDVPRRAETANSHAASSSEEQARRDDRAAAPRGRRAQTPTTSGSTARTGFSGP